MLKSQAYSKNEATSWPIPNYWDVIGIVIVFAIIMSLAIGAKGMVSAYNFPETIKISLNPANLPYYALRTILRLFIALGFSLIFTFTIGTLAAKNKHAERLIIPMIDILQSIPVLSFLSITMIGFITLFRGSMLGPECAAIFAIFTSQVWNMTLSFYQSVRTVPSDLKEASKIFCLSKWQTFWRIEVPFAMPQLLWNIMMSMSGSWYFVTASEAFSVANQNITLPGIGSYIAEGIVKANSPSILYAILTMLLVIFLYDQLLFRPLTYWAEKFQAAHDEEATISRSFVVSFFQRTKFLRALGKILSSICDFFINPRSSQQTTSSKYQEQKVKIYKNITRFYYLILTCVLMAATFIIIKFIMATFSLSEVKHVLAMGTYTAIRVLSLIILSSLIWVPIGVWIGLRPKITPIAQPIVQFLAAFPTNLFFPIAAMIFLRYNLNPEIWVSPLMVMGTQWYILFNVIAGASNLPKDLKQAAATFKVTGLLKWRRVILPAIGPFYITGAITAAGGAWNASIIAEVIKWGNNKFEATGLGAYIADNFANNNFANIALGTIVMCLFVLVINRLIWRPLYNLAMERYEVE
jgi:NitT/TauT family transport system permease protein